MRNPMDLDVCPLTIRFALRRLSDEVGTTMVERAKFARSHPQLLRAGMKLLTCKRTPNELSALLTHLTTCECVPCKFNQASIAPHSEKNLKSLGFGIMMDIPLLICNFCALTLNESTQHKFRQPKMGERPENQPWPLGPDDLLPYGLKGSLEGLSTWASGDYGFEGNVIQLGTALTTFYRPFGQEVLRSRSFSVDVPFRHLGRALKRYTKGGPIDASLGQDPGFEYEVERTLEFIHPLIDLDQGKFCEMVAGRAWIGSIFEDLMNILAVSPDQSWSRQSLTIYVVLAHAQAKIDPATGKHKVVIDPKDMDRYTPIYNDHASAFEVMARTRRGACGNITCPADFEGTRSRLCAKCNLLRYCGEKCQKEAWNHPKFPHKVLCQKIYTLKQQAGSDNWTRFWTPGYSLEGFLEACRKASVDMGLLSHVGLELDELFAARMNSRSSLSMVETRRKAKT